MTSKRSRSVKLSCCLVGSRITNLLAFKIPSIVLMQDMTTLPSRSTLAIIQAWASKFVLLLSPLLSSVFSNRSRIQSQNLIETIGLPLWWSLTIFFALSILCLSSKERSMIKNWPPWYPTTMYSLLSGCKCIQVTELFSKSLPLSTKREYGLHVALL